ncbi:MULTISPECIES: hypothetical protein [unclassified Pseudonocardia]|uniref:ATP dependent DNA ligase n=1 Tax=unclassified Pseudonocardia TaxID=2619320 RepID=UPI0020C95B98|nr:MULTISPECIES: hypothetical protein [unclassified Pseudonocardia]
MSTTLSISSASVRVTPSCSVPAPAGTRRDLLALLTKRELPAPAIDVLSGRSAWASPTPMHLRRWVRPGLIGEIDYRQQTAEGRFRHPSWRGMRPDLGPDDLDPV